MKDAAETGELDVVVVVGTDHHPFDRLVQWVDRWAAARGCGERCLVQYGSSRPPTHTKAVEFLGRDELLAHFRAARVVVSHGGPSLIVEALRNDRFPVVLPRSPARGEHVDEHQEHFADVMAAKGMIRLVTDEASLDALLDDELAAPGPAPVEVQLPPAAAAAEHLGEAVERLTAGGPSRRLRWLRARRR